MKKDRSKKNLAIFMLKYLFVIVALSFVIAISVVYFFQRTSVFPGAGWGKTELPAHYKLDMEEVYFNASDGVRVMGWYKAPADILQPTIAYYHGNGGNLSNRVKKYQMLMDQGYGLLALSYRGFANSEGEPTEEGVYKDARAAIKFIKEKGVIESNIILYGESLGTGIATKMATEIEAKALILEAPYESIAKAGQQLFWFMPVELLLWDNFSNIDKIKDVTEPVLIFHGEKDLLVPVSHSKNIFKAANEPKKIVYFPNRRHDLDMNKMVPIVKQFIDEL